RVHGPKATTNQSLGLLAAEVSKTKACKRAAKLARRVVREHWSGELAKRYEALKTVKTYAQRKAIFAGIRAIGRPTPGSRVRGEALASTAAKPPTGHLGTQISP